MNTINNIEVIIMIHFRDPSGYTSNELNLINHQVKSARSRRHSMVHWTLSLAPEFVLSTSR